MGRNILKSGFTWLCLFSFWICAAVSHAQNITGQIDGTVRDKTGAVVVGAVVNITNTDTKELVRTIKTNKQGEYVAASLQVGTYDIQVVAPGFEQGEVTAVDLNVGDTLTKDVKLTLGSSEAVTVTSGAGVEPDTETNQSASIIDSTQIKELALNTRNFEQILLLQPGVSYGGPDELNAGQVSPTGERNSHQLSVNGLQPTQVGFLLDGADFLNHTTNGQVSIFPSIDAIAQVQTVRNNYGAQYGGGGSAVSIIVTKAGGAEFHGDGYYFFRHQALDATPYFNLLQGIAKPALRYNDFGFTIGGPAFIPKIYPRSHSKTFFFYGMEFKRIGQAVQNENTTFPTLANTYGYFTSPVCPGIALATSCPVNRAQMVSTTPYPGYNFQIPIDPVAQEYVNDVFRPSVLSTPGSNNPATPNNVLFSQNSSTSETQELVRFDHQFSERLSGFFRFINDPVSQIIPNAINKGTGFPTVSTTMVHTFGRDYLGHLTWTARPNTVLEFGYSYLPYETDSVPIGSASAANSPDVQVNLPFPNTTGRIPAIQLLGSFWGAVGTFADHSVTYQWFENTTTSIGKHTLYYGINVEHLTDSGNPGTNNAGAFQFSGVQNTVNLGAPGTTCPPAAPGVIPPPPCYKISQFDQTFAQFLSGTATTFTQASVDAHSEPRENLYEAYIQDQWRATATLTLNAGVRYSIYQAPGEFSPDLSANHAFPQGKLGGFQPEAYVPGNAPAIGTTGTICTTTSTAPCAGVTPNNTTPLNGITGGGATTSPYGRALSRTPFLDFAPRAGFAWNVYGNGKTSLRGGFGIFYEQQPLTTFQNAVTGNPAYVQNPVYTTPGSFLNPGVQAAGTSAVQSITGIDRTWKQPYVEAWNLDVQQQLTKSDLVDIGYAGNATVHLQGEEDLNQIPAGLYAKTGVTGCVNGVVTLPGSGAPVVCYPIAGSTETYLNQIRPYLGWGPISFVSTRYFANYSGLQASLIHRQSKELTIGLSYTWSKSLANDGGPPNGGSGAQQFDPQDRFNLHNEWGPSLLDRRNIFNANFVYNLPSHSSYHGFVGGLVNGWELSGIIQLVGGLQVTAYEGNFDGGGQGGAATGSNAQLRPDVTADPNHGPKTQTMWFNSTTLMGTQTPTPGVNYVFHQAPQPLQDGGNERIGAIRGPGYETFNLDVFKNIELPENMKFQIRVEAFNLPNHVNFKNLQTQTANGLFGSVTSAYENRILQVGAKLTF